MTDTKITEREIRRADELKTGDWLAVDQLIDDGGRPSEVLDLFPGGSGMLLLVYRPADGEPDSTHLEADTMLELATQAELDAHRDLAKRERIAVELRELADLIMRHELPLPQYSMSITASFPNADAVRRIGEVLDLEVRSRKPSPGVEVEWPKGRASYEQGVHVTWLTIHDEPEPVATPAQLAAVAEKLRADQAAEPDAPRELLAIAPAADGGVAFALAPAGTVTDPVQRAKVVELTEAVAENIEAAAAEPSCQGAPSGFETDCGIDGEHGPHGPEPVGNDDEPAHKRLCNAPSADECICDAV